MESMQQDPDYNDSGLIEGSETEDDAEFSHSDEEDPGTNGRATSEDSLHLRFVNIKYLLFFPLWDRKNFIREKNN